MTLKLPISRSPKIVFVFVSPYDTDNVEFGNHLIKHGDGVKDVAFEVEDLDVIVKRARERGAEILRDIWEENDEFGTVRFATIKTVRSTWTQTRHSCC
jgi:4-hydroxyphenylpyruvate dioxygenase